MIFIADYISGVPRRRLEQAQRFIAHYGSGSITYSVQSDDRAISAADVVVTYSRELFAERAPKSIVIITGKYRNIEFKTHLYDAIRLLILLTYDRSSADLWINLQDDQLKAEDWLSLGIRQDHVFKPAVEAFLPGAYLAPFSNGFAYFTVDRDGEVTVEAEADDLWIVLLQFRSIKAYSDERIVNEFGKFSALA